MAKMTLDDLATQLRAAYPGALRAVVLYGSAAGGEHHAKHSDQNVLVIVRALSLEAMRAAGAVARAWRENGNPPPLTLTESEWRSSVDVFAMEHADSNKRPSRRFALKRSANQPPANRPMAPTAPTEMAETLLACLSPISWNRCRNGV